LAEDWEILGEEPKAGITTIQNINLHSSETTEEKEAQSLFTSLLEASVPDVGQIANCVLTYGVPNEFRGQIWQLLLGYLPTNKLSRSHVLKFQRRSYLRLVEKHYTNLDEDESSEDGGLLHIVKVDVERTHPSIVFSKAIY
jgi:hypothetical protein